jgi:hypothetical protein
MNGFLSDLRSIKGMTLELEVSLISSLEYYWPAPRRDAAHRAAVRHLQRGRRGRPQDIHRQALRLSVFHVLAAHGLPMGNCRGRAAQALLAVFEEADRRDGTPARDSGALSLADRAVDRFGRKQWAKWLAEYRDDLAVLKGGIIPSPEKIN